MYLGSGTILPESGIRNSCVNKYIHPPFLTDSQAEGLAFDTTVST